MTGLLPGAATIGVLAPILLVMFRIITGLGLGGEFGGATALLAEFGSKRKYRAFWTGFANAGFSIGGFLGAIVLGVFSSTFTTTGWRIGFLLTLAIIVPSLISRYAITETPYMVKLIGERSQVRFPSLSVFKKFTAPIILLAMFSAFQQFDGYAALTYMVSYMEIAGYSLVLIAFIVGIGRLYDFAGLAVNGWFSRVFKRRMTGIIFLAVPTIFSYPYVLSILDKNIPMVLITELVLVVFGVGAMHAFAPVLASEQFPTKYRYSGTGLAYELSAVIGGMFTPAILSGLIGNDVTTKYYYIPAFYVLYFAVGLTGILLLKETKDIDLEALDANT
jgi:MFS family permease